MQRIRHPLFALGGLTEDDIVPGMHGYRWLRAKTTPPGFTNGRSFPDRIVRRPVTVVGLEFAEFDSIMVIEEYKQTAFGGGRVDERPPLIYNDKLLTPMRLLHRINVRDEETSQDTGKEEILDFHIDPPVRKNGVMENVHIFTLEASKRQWRLRLGERRDDRHEDIVPRDKRGRIIGPIDRDDIEE